MSYKCIKTVKHTISNITRTEVETEIDFDSDGILLFNQCNVPLSKKRYILPYSNDDSLSWEVDVYDSKNIEDIIIEIEIPSEDYPLVLPQWVGEEITHDPSYSNLQLFLSENSHILY
jgi:CYTH domain-containing protein